MEISAKDDMNVLMPRLKRWLDTRVGSLRSIAKQTEGLQPPEIMAHSNLSRLLTQKPGASIYLQQAVVLMKIMRIHPAALFLDTDEPAVANDAIKVANAFIRLKPARRDAILEEIVSETRRAAV